ncbi:hypothetical protein EH223_02620 [candidate division KSB1 bacterium]|nr:glycosyltransferase family 39 protein [candidate division KSB1 bacterium]RQW06290.1 MAG: hypothetical protein EH223_02620 [candidate division KSB1 bacterium]
MKALVLFVQKKRLLLLLCIAILLRLFYILTLEDRWYYFDTAHYDQAARALLESGTFGSSLHYYDEYEHYCLEPVYPVFLAGIYAVFGHSFLAVRLVQLILSVLQLLILYNMVRLLRPGAAILALVLGAIYPFFIYISGLLYVTQLFALLLTFAFYSFLKYSQSSSILWLLIAALSLGIAIAARPVALPSTILLAVWIMVFADLGRREKIGHIALFACLIALVLTPWTVRNWTVFHVFSPGRACLAETRVFSYVDLELRIEESKKMTSFPGRIFHVNVIDSLAEPVFECFLDGTLIAKLQVCESFQRPQNSYYGLIFKGGASMSVERLQVGNGAEIVLDSRFASTVKHSSNLTVRQGAIELGETAEGWQYAAIYASAVSANTFSMFYPSSIDPHDVSRLAILFDLDSFGLEANGYMIWLHPWMQADMWKVENGRPARSVETIDLYAKENPTSLKQLVKKYPVRFFTRHVLPEFINFWSPTIKRVTTSDNVSSDMTIMSLLFFTPVLIFFLIGLYVLRNQWKSLLILLIPIMTISLFYSIFFTELRYRIPVDGFLIVGAAIGVEYLFHFFKEKF